MSNTLFLLLLFFLVVLTAFAEEEAPRHLECVKGSIIAYSYYSVTENVQGGERGTEQASQFQEKTTLRCKVEVECVEQFQNKNDPNKIAYLYAVNFTQIQMFQQNKQHPLDPSFFIGAPTHSKTAIPFDPHYNLGKRMDKEFTFPFAYTMSRNGKLLRVYHHQQEAPWVTQIKKSVVQNLETKLSGSSRLEYTPNGVTQNHYKQKTNSKNELVVKKVHKENDIVQTPNGSNSDNESGNNNHLKQIREKCTSTQKIAPNGVVRVAKEKQSVVIGGKPHGKHTHNAFKDQRHKHEYRDSLNGDMKNPVRETAKVRMILLDITPKKNSSTDPKKTLLSLIKPLDWDQLGNDFDATASTDAKTLSLSKKYSSWKLSSLKLQHDDHHDDEVSVLMNKKQQKGLKKMNGNVPHLLLHPKMVESTAMADLSLYLFAQKVASERLFREYNFLQQLQMMKTQQSDLVPLSRLVLYCKRHPATALPILHQEFMSAIEELAERTTEVEQLINYIKMLQTLIVSVSTKKAQQMLLKTIDAVLESKALKPSHALILLEHAVHRMPGFDHPTNSMIEYLSAFQKIFLSSKTTNTSEAEKRHLEQLKLDSYMIFTAVAPKHSKHRPRVIQDIVNNIKYSNSSHEKEFYVYALYNAGKHVPIPILEYMIFEQDGLFSKVEKSIAVKSLTKKIHVSEHDAVHDLILRVIKSKKVAPEVKAAAIATQMARERKMHKTGLLIPHFAKLYTNSSKTAVPIIKEALEEYFHEEGSYEAGEALAFRLVPQQQNDMEEEEEEEVEVLRVSNDVKDMFKAATFDATPKSYVASQMGDRFTLYDGEMQRFFDDRNDYMKFADNNFSRHFAFERIIGVKAANFYLGVAGYAGSRCEDSDVKSDFQFQFVAKGVARAEIFRRRVHLVNLEFAFAKVKGKPLDQRLYLNVLEHVVVNRKFYEDPDADTMDYCDRKTNRINLFEKHFDKIFGVSFVFMISFIPLTIEIRMAATLGVDFGYYYCPRNMITKFSIEPYIETGPVLDIGIGIPLLAAGVTVQVSVSYRLIPFINAEKCSLCIGLDHEVMPFGLTVGLWIRLLIFTFRVNLFTIKAPTIRGNIFKRCIDGEAMANIKFISDTFAVRGDMCMLTEQVNRSSHIKKQIKAMKKVIKRKPGVDKEIATYNKLLQDKREQRRLTHEATLRQEENEIINSTKLLPEAIINFYSKAKDEIDIVAKINWSLEMNLLSFHYDWTSIAKFYTKLLVAMKKNAVKELFSEEYNPEELSEEISGKIKQVSFYGNQMTHNDFIKIYSIRTLLKRLARQLKRDRTKYELISALSQQTDDFRKSLETLYNRWIDFKPMKSLLGGFLQVWQSNVPIYTKAQFLKKVSRMYGKEKFNSVLKDKAAYMRALKTHTTAPIFKKRCIEREAMKLQKNLAFRVEAKDLKGVKNFYESFLNFEKNFRLHFINRATQVVESEYRQAKLFNPTLTEEEYYRNKEMEAIQASIEAPFDLLDNEEKKSQFIKTSAQEIFEQEEKSRNNDLVAVLKHEADIKAEDDVYINKMNEIKIAYQKDESRELQRMLAAYKQSCHSEIQYVEQCVNVNMDRHVPINNLIARLNVHSISKCLHRFNAQKRRDAELRAKRVREILDYNMRIDRMEIQFIKKLPWHLLPHQKKKRLQEFRKKHPRKQL